METVIDLGQITSSMAGSLVELYVNELSRTDEITPGVGANKLLKYWPPALTEWSTKDPVGPSAGVSRVNRGGCWNNHALTCGPTRLHEAQWHRSNSL